MCSGHVTRVSGGSGDIIYDDQVRQYNGPHGGSIETTGHWPHTALVVLPVVPCPLSLPVQIQLCNRHKVATRRFITLFIFPCSMPRQQQCVPAGRGRRDTVETCHHAITQAALVPSQGRHSTNTVNIPTMVTVNNVSTVSCPARD